MHPSGASSTSSNHARAPWAPSLHTIHDFDGAPERISLTWPGHTNSKQRVPVATVREQLQAGAESRAQQPGKPLEQTPWCQDLHTIANLADEHVLIKHQVVAPHPRCTLWFDESGEKWGAITNASTPAILLPAQSRQRPRCGMTTLRPDRS